jgi:N-acetylmuramoyl-L-alanine amidase
LKTLSRSKSGNLYRYFFGKSSTLEKANKKLKEANNKGYSKAFIVAFDGEIKISVSEALDRLK